MYCWTWGNKEGNTALPQFGVGPLGERNTYIHNKSWVQSRLPQSKRPISRVRLTTHCSPWEMADLRWLPCTTRIPLPLLLWEMVRSRRIGWETSGHFSWLEGDHIMCHCFSDAKIINIAWGFALKLNVNLTNVAWKNHVCTWQSMTLRTTLQAAKQCSSESFL